MEFEIDKKHMRGVIKAWKETSEHLLERLQDEDVVSRMLAYSGATQCLMMLEHIHKWTKINMNAGLVAAAQASKENATEGEKSWKIEEATHPMFVDEDCTCDEEQEEAESLQKELNGVQMQVGALSRKQAIKFMQMMKQFAQETMKEEAKH